MAVRNSKYYLIMWVTLALLFGLAPNAILGQSGTGTLRVAIHDKATGNVVPAIVCITSLADNTWRVPPDGRHPAGYVKNDDFESGTLLSIEHIAGYQKKWFPGDPGPAVVMNGNYPSDRGARYGWYYGGPAIPFWKEPAGYFISEPFTITLPPGKWRLAVMRGFEYVPVYEEFTVAAGQNLVRDIQLARYVDMAKLGWYSCDPHVHSWRIAPLHDEFITTYAKAMGVHLTVTMNPCVHGDCRDRTQAEYGKASWYNEGDYWLDSGTEDPREGIEEEGHVSQLDIQHVVRDPDKYELYSYVFDGAHAQGGLVGYDHLAWSHTYYARTNPKFAEQHPYPGWDASINTIRGKVDFFSILQNNNLGLDYYYDFLNLGVKVTATASTDYPSPVVGEEMTYAYTGPGGTFTPDTWYEAVKAGRTFVTNGPMLTLTVGKAMPGDEARVGKNDMLHIHAEAWAPESIGSPKVIEIVAEGRVIRSAESHNSQQDRLTMDFELPAGESQWVAARTTAFNGSVAHTNPVYVIVDGKSFIDRANAKQLVAKQLKVLDYIESKKLNDPEFTATWGPGLVPLVWRDVELARARYLSLADAPDRPAITGIADIAFRVSNLDAARNYYGHVLGLDEQFSLSPDRAEGPPAITYYKVNDRQYIEISPGLKNESEDKLIRIGYETEDAARLRDYLASRGVGVPAKVTKDSCGNLSFTVKDPDGHEVEFVQYLPRSIQKRNFGNNMPNTRISDHILHVGIHVADSAKADAFYKDILGFRLLWEGGPPQNPKAWISYLVPDGTDWVEYMTSPNPDPKRLADMHHVCLEVMDIQKPFETVLTRGYTPPAAAVIGRDGRWLANFFDPDGTRTELMIRKPVEKPCCKEMHDPFILK